MAGIIGYGFSLPFMRIKVEEIHRVWKNTNLGRIKNGMKVNERAVLQPNEDTLTLAIAAARGAIENAGIARESIDALFLGTYTNPYDSRPSMTTIAEAIGTKKDVMGCDVQFSGKSCSTAIQICSAMVDSGMARMALAIGSDTINRHTCPGREYEYAASAGAAAFVIGKDKPILKIFETSSYVSELSDFFRVEGERYIQNIGLRGELYPAWEVGFADHVIHAAQAVMNKAGFKAGDYDYAVFQQPGGFAPYAAGERLGFSKEQIDPGVIAPDIGDCGSASAMLGLANVLDTAKAGQKILLVTYGFGAGSDAFSLEVMPAIEAHRQKVPIAKYLAENKSLVDYATACRLEYKYMQDMSPLYR